MKIAPITEEIITITGSEPGPTVAIFAGVHGNERAGIYALQELIPKLKLTKGTLHLAFANPPAIKANVRFINKNLNRRFFTGNDGEGYEDTRARELMAVLDQCDALLDLHMFYSDGNTEPFAICEEPSIDVASVFDLPLIATNFTNVEKGGSDGYMFLNGKVGICVECGPISQSDELKDYAAKTVYQFLQYYDMIEPQVALSDKPKKILKALYAVKKDTETITLEPGFKNFDSLSEDQLIAVDGSKQYLAKKNECILFPHYSARVGEELYIIGLQES